MSDDIENTINNFVIEADAMRAALREQSDRVVELTEALQRAAVENQRARKGLADMVQSGVQQQAAQQIAAACRPLIESISTAAGQAERAMSSKLQEVEASQMHGWLITTLVALAAGSAGAALALFAVRLFPLVWGMQ